MAHAQQVKGGPWFEVFGKAGDRTLRQQMMGLQPLMQTVEGRSVLDVGCAEGLISLECLRAGAAQVHGLEIRKSAVQTAITVAQNDPIAKDREWLFEEADANTAAPQRDYDIVLMLAVLHKLRDPLGACMRFAAAALHLVVIRLPPENAPKIIDARSGNSPVDIDLAMRVSGFERARAAYDGPFGEWLGYYRRTRA